MDLPFEPSQIETWPIKRLRFGVELHPAYVAVAIERWQSFPEEEAMLE